MNKLEILEIRNKLGLNQEDFGKLIGVSKNTVYNYENGSKIPESKIPILRQFLISSKNETHGPSEVLNEPIEKYNKGVPYYDVEFTAGFLEVENNQSILPDSYISHPFFKGCDYVVRASGQSMAKVICHGDAIGLVKIKNWKEFFPYGEIYAIVTNDGFRMVKIITKGETDETYTLISKPTDSKKDEFPPQQIKIGSILSIFKVQASSHLY